MERARSPKAAGTPHLGESLSEKGEHNRRRGKVRAAGRKEGRPYAGIMRNHDPRFGVITLGRRGDSGNGGDVHLSRDRRKLGGRAGRTTVGRDQKL